MQKLIVKLICATAVFICVNWIYCGYLEEWVRVDLGFPTGPTFLPWPIGIPLLLVLLYLTGELGEKYFPQQTLKQRRIFRAVTKAEFWGTVCLWSIFNFLQYVILFSWLLVAVSIVLSMKYQAKRLSVREAFTAYLREQEVPADSVLGISIRYSLLRRLRRLPEWVIEAEFTDTPGVRSYFFSEKTADQES